MKTYLPQSLCDHQNCQLKEKYTTGELWVKFFSGSYWERWPRREPLSSEKLLQSSGVEASLDVIFVMEYMQSCLHLGKRLLLVTKNRYIDFNDYSPVYGKMQEVWFITILPEMHTTLQEPVYLKHRASCQSPISSVWSIEWFILFPSSLCLKHKYTVGQRLHGL